MNSARSIRALDRGLQVLEAANLANGTRLREFVAVTGLPKATTFRILEHLRRAGYLRRDEGDDRYYLTLRVRRLSDGFFDGGWISEIARPVLLKLSGEVGFPVAIATPWGTAMMLRDNTDARSPLGLNVYSRGTTLPLFTSATGKVYLAFCDGVTRRTLLETCAASGLPEHALARQPAILASALAAVRRQGYAFGPGESRERRGVRTATIAVPIRARTQLIGGLAMRYLAAGLSRETVVARYLGRMSQHARLIGTRVAAEAGGAAG